MRNQQQHERKMRIQRLYTNALCGVLAFLLYFLVIVVALAIFSGCQKVQYIEKEVLVPFEVQIPVPQKCDYEMPSEIKPNTRDLQGLFNSLTELLQADKELRSSLHQIPCLNIK